MNESITKQIEEMKKQTIGVEVEMNNIRRDKAAELAAAFFGTGRFENTASRNGYYTWSAWEPRVMQQGDAESTSTSEQMDTHRRLYEILQTSWRDTRTF